MSRLGTSISPFSKEYVRTRTSERMDDECIVYKPGQVIIDPVTQIAHRGPKTIRYQGPCRFWEVPATQQIMIGDERIGMSSSYLSLPYNSPVPEADDIVQITKSDDTDLIGRTVQVTGAVRGGGLRASRRFMVQLATSEKDTW